MTNTIKKIGRISFLSLLTLSAAAVSAYFILRLPPSQLSVDQFRGVEIAHRGGYENGPENTIPTIIFNLGHGVTAFEVDVQLSKDGIPILFHDSTLSRLTGHPGRVEQLSLAELKSLNILDQEGEVTGARIASLEELMDTLSKVAPNALLELDLKFYGDEQDKLLMEALALVDRYHARERVLFSSFDPRLIYKLRKMDPEVLTGFAHTTVSGEGGFTDWLLNLVLVPKFLGVAAIEPHLDLVDADYVHYWKKRGLVINAWTANTTEDKDRLRGLGVTLTTNCPNKYCENREEDLWAVPATANAERSSSSPESAFSGEFRP